MTAKTCIFPLIVFAGFLVSAGPTLAVAQTAAVSARSTQGEDEPQAQKIRSEFMTILKDYPPQVGQILKLDPSLLSSDTYLAQYPAVTAFLTKHPEVRRSPAYYLEQVRSNSDYYSYYDPRTRAWDNMMEMMAVLVVILTIVGTLGWLIRTAVDYRRWGRLAKVQAEAHTKLLDRFTGNDELLAYVQSSAGAKFLKSSPISLDGTPRQMGAPLSRILWSMQAGVVLAAAGIGMNYVSRNIDPNRADPVFTLSVILLSLGVGFVASAGLSYLMSKRLGLLQADGPQDTEE